MDKPPTTDALTGASPAPALPTIPDAPISNQGERTNQQSLLPGAVQARNVGNIIGSSASGLGNGLAQSFTVTTGTSASFIFTVRDKLNRTIIAIPDVAVYIDTISNANQWPNTTYGMATMPVTVFNDWGLTDNINVVTRVVVRNNLVADVPVIVVCRWRIITNASADLSQSNTTGGNLLTSASGLYGGSGGPH